MKIQFVDGSGGVSGTTTDLFYKNIQRMLCHCAQHLHLTDANITVLISTSRIPAGRTSASVNYSYDMLNNDEPYVLFLANPKIYHNAFPVFVEICMHEMVHVEQIVRGDLAATPENVRLWKGEKFCSLRADREYFKMPWEVEAYNRQIGLAHSWLKQHGFETRPLTNRLFDRLTNFLLQRL